jgi:predicted MFS family arabinose efflux permease
MYPYGERGRPLGWLFGAMAGGMAFGSPLGALVIPLTDWSGLFILVGASGLIILLLFRRYLAAIEFTSPQSRGTLRDLFRSYTHILRTARAQRTYVYVLLNSMFHSGVFTWLGVYLERRYHLGPAAIGVALLGYGVPGFLFGPLIGRAADRWGRAKLIPIGLILSSLAAMALMLDVPVMLVPVIVIILSLGYDMTQPLFGGIVTSFSGRRAGQAMGLNVFMLFVGFGLGSLSFGELMRYGFTAAFGIFATVELFIALLSFRLFSSELPQQQSVAADMLPLSASLPGAALSRQAPSNLRMDNHRNAGEPISSGRDRRINP